MTTPSTLRREVHILIGCSDARDIGHVFVESVAATKAAFLERGILVELHSVRTPGSFITYDAIEDLRRIVDAAERQQFPRVGPPDYYVHIQTHGDVGHSPSGGADGTLHRLVVNPSATYNCGMLGATALAIELEKLILDQRPTIDVAGRPLTIDSEDAIRALLRDRYAHTGFMAGDWIQSIDDLRAHPRRQKVILQEAIDASRTLRSVPIHVTAGIQDYAENVYYRVDGEERLTTFWDEMYAEIRRRMANIAPDDPEVLERTAKQSPSCGLFSMGNVRGARNIAAMEYARLQGRDSQTYSPNTVFAFASRSFDLPRTMFGPYTIAGFFFAVRNLGLRDFVMLGHDRAQAERITTRMHNDPLMNLIARTHDVRFHPLGVDGLPPMPDAISGE